jgi:polar amino acid transport system substrate-binding protein
MELVENKGKIMIRNKLMILIICLGLNIYADKLADIKKSGILRVGVKVDFDPFGFKNRNGKIIGFDIDMMKYIADNLHVKLKLIPVSSSTRIPFILSDKIDVAAASMTHKIKRDRKIDFTISYFFDGQAIIARRTSHAKSYKDYEGKTVGALKGSSSGKVFEAVQPMSTVIYYDNVNQLKKALTNKKIAAFTSDYAFLSAIVKKSNSKFKVIGRPFTVEPYGMGMKENESNLRDELNFIIQRSVKTGVYTKIYKKWFGKRPRKKPPLWP